VKENLESVLKKHAELNVFADSFNLGHLTKTSPEDLEAALRRLPYANAAELSKFGKRSVLWRNKVPFRLPWKKAQAARLWGLYWGLHSGGKTISPEGTKELEARLLSLAPAPRPGSGRS